MANLEAQTMLVFAQTITYYERYQKGEMLLQLFKNNYSLVQKMVDK